MSEYILNKMVIKTQTTLETPRTRPIPLFPFITHAAFLTIKRDIEKAVRPGEDVTLIPTQFGSFKVPDRMINGCWIWPGRTNSTGYSTIYLNNSCVRPEYQRVFPEGKTLLVHRILFSIIYSFAIPQNTYVTHKCNEPNCNNPNHAEYTSQMHNLDFMLQCRRNPIRGILTETQVAEIFRNVNARVYTISEASEIFKVSKATVRSILRGAAWQHVTANI